MCHRAQKSSGELGLPGLGAPGKVQLENEAVKTANSSEVLLGILVVWRQYRLV